MYWVAVKWWHGWAPLVVLPGAVLVLALPSWPRWAAMWALAVAIYAGCKWLTWRRTPVDRAPWWRHAAYLLAWPGLNAIAFLVESPARRPARTEWIRGVRNLVLGTVLFFGVARLLAPVTLLRRYAPSIAQACLAELTVSDDRRYLPTIAHRSVAPPLRGQSARSGAELRTTAS